jgi:hypothetical protein
MRMKSGIKVVGNGEWERVICCRMINVRINRNTGSLLLPVQGYCNVVAFSPTCAGKEGVDHVRHPTTPHGASPDIGPRYLSFREDQQMSSRFSQTVKADHKPLVPILCSIAVMRTARHSRCGVM